jgi:hypothetical protein
VFLRVCVFANNFDLLVHVAAAYQPYQRDFKFCRAYPVALFGCLPNVALVDWNVLIVLTAKIANAKGKVNVETASDGL